MSVQLSKLFPKKFFRHCAYCLVPIRNDDVKLCGKCHRRAYCSRTCQTLDWSDNTTQPPTKGQRGQSHKNWCKLLCGEEDLDWIVISVTGKGLGLRALKSIPARSRIIVEAGQTSPESHPCIKDLLPEGGTLQQKWDLNLLPCAGGNDQDSGLCLRIARANHSCTPNAGHVYCPTFNVKILFAERDIKAGEEICVSYVPFCSPTSSTPTTKPNEISSHKALYQQFLRKWNIVCDEECVCQDDKTAAVSNRAKELNKAIASMAHELEADQCLRGVKKLLVLYDKIQSSHIDWVRTLWDGFQAGIMTKKTLPEGIECLTQLIVILEDILHPKSVSLLKYKEVLKDPASHGNYLSQEGTKGGIKQPSATNPEDMEKMLKLLAHFTNLNKTVEKKLKK